MECTYNAEIVSATSTTEISRTNALFWELIADISNLLNYFVQQSPSWETNRFSASQEIPRTL